MFWYYMKEAIIVMCLLKKTSKKTASLMEAVNKRMFNYNKILLGLIKK